MANETDDSDIIECSIVKNAEKTNIMERRVPKKNSPKRITSKKKDCEADLNSNSNIELIRLSLRKNYKILPHEIDEVISIDCQTPPPRTPLSSRDEQSARRHLKIISSLEKNQLNMPHLSKSKLRNVKRWLEQNDFETVRTPPFVNLSVSPVTTGKKRFPKNRKGKHETDENNSIDSDVEGILKAVYGSDWIDENVRTKCKTEPKKKTNSHLLLTKEKKESFQLFRRNILKSGKTNHEEDSFEDSVISGVEMINLDDSNAGTEKFKLDDLMRDLKSSRKQERDPQSSTKSQESVRPDVKRTLRKKILASDTRSEKKSGKKEKEDSSLGKPQSWRKLRDKTPKKTFLASLSVSTPNSRCHPEADYYKKNFKAKKDELLKKLYKLYNSEVFECKLPEDMNFSWNVKLRGTAGYCYNKRITKSTGEILRTSRIEFSTKIVDRADRLRDTMIHELCHAASWIVDATLDGHGAVWNAWATRACLRFPELPNIRRCHNYEIMAKYIYRCTGCGYSIKRHSKSIDTERKRCGHCFGILELLLNKKRKGKGEVPEFDATRTLRTPNKFAVFVKENYRSVKLSKINAKHAEIMKILSEKYAILKNENNCD